MKVTRMKSLATAVVLAFLPIAAQAELAVNTQIYTCENATETTVTYVGTDTEGLVVFTHDGAQLALMQQVSASGVKFGPAPGEVGIVWWNKGTEGSIWTQGKTEAEDVLVTNCVEKQ